ncbi:protein kinase [Rhodococcus oxybenzonivorans]|uniref:protein kinase domain-containing protein n=1 Tax=Rhodococcus oxybenzonivorans TaxID=1990687 RepID=UPI002954FA9A|nr:protein kinase [Rhodococcus oxybenzonivorans]MDV7353253.1 protein kinase [Rhodococcus oxybenzonivorans]
MVACDPFATQRDLPVDLTTELTAAGFEHPVEIGKGGFGVVYKCAQPDLDRVVAVKVLTADLDEINRARFFREQRAMGRLTGHPNIVSILHVGTTGSGRPYLVMPYYSRDSLEMRVRREGPMTQSEALRVGVKIAGALETAHRAGILHRDVKPGNILLTDYGEPVLTDFGIAHIAGGFHTATGTVTGSPAYTAPEVLGGGTPSAASDIYGLGATLFCAVTGHAAFERRSGEQVVAQFLRITTQAAPDPREHGVDSDVSSVIESAMAANPRDRPATAAEFGEQLRQVQLREGFPVDDMALPGEPDNVRRPQPGPTSRMPARKIPLETTSFVGRRRELDETKRMLSDARLVTLTGIGGVGKTRLALRLAADLNGQFRDGAVLVELGELQDQSLLVSAVAAAVGIRDHSSRFLVDVIIEQLIPKNMLLVLDNCEHLVDAVAVLTETLIRTCGELKIVATSREPLGIGGEAVLRVPPLTVPDAETDSLASTPSEYDGVMLFMERATAAVPGFELTDDNRPTITRICQRLEGLPLPIELAAARLRALSLDQVLQRLTDRYRLLTVGSRGAPTRQQTLRLSVDWSYDLCTPRERQVWARVSVFAGVFELDDANGICGLGMSPEDLLDALASLVDKSILIREEWGTTVCFRMLETLREYGREKAEETAEFADLRRRHHDWYQRLVVEAEAEWISAYQLEWITRLERENSNLREALEFSLARDDDAAIESSLTMTATLLLFWLTRGRFNEGRNWLGRALARKTQDSTAERVKALYAASVLAEIQGDLSVAADFVAEGEALVAQMPGDKVTHARIAHADGLYAIYSGDLPRACSRLEEALRVFKEEQDSALHVWTLMMLGLAYQLNGDAPRAIACHEQVLTITKSRGESVYRSYSLWARGVAAVQQDDFDGAEPHLEQCLRLTRRVDEPLTAAVCLEALSWIACRRQTYERAAVLMGAAEAMGRSVGSSAVLFHNLTVYHDECQALTREALGPNRYHEAHQYGALLGFDPAVAYALEEPSVDHSADADHSEDPN